jgi:hypothetical protein
MINLQRLAVAVMAMVFLGSSFNCAGDESLPKPEDIIKSAVKRSEVEAQNDIDFKQRYYFVRSKLTEIRNFEGELKKSDLRVSTNYPPKVIVAPKPKPETEPVAMPVVRSPKAEQLASSGANKAVARKFDKNQFQFNDDLVGRYDFKLIGREVTNCYSLLVLDFTPKKTKLPEDGIRDRLINRVAGRVWIDEREFAVKRCTLQLLESVSIIGGIVGEAQKFEYSFDRERTEDGLWYVRDSAWHLEGREVIVHRKADYHETRTEVRKGDTEAASSSPQSSPQLKADKRD